MIKFLFIVFCLSFFQGIAHSAEVDDFTKCNNAIDELSGKKPQKNADVTIIPIERPVVGKGNMKGFYIGINGKTYFAEESQEDVWDENTKTALAVELKSKIASNKATITANFEKECTRSTPVGDGKRAGKYPHRASKSSGAMHFSKTGDLFLACTKISQEGLSKSALKVIGEGCAGGAASAPAKDGDEGDIVK